MRFFTFAWNIVGLSMSYPCVVHVLYISYPSFIHVFIHSYPPTQLDRRPVINLGRNNIHRRGIEEHLQPPRCWADVWIAVEDPIPDVLVPYINKCVHFWGRFDAN